MTDKKPAKRGPATISVLDAIETMQTTDSLTDDDSIGVLKGSLEKKIVQEARRR